MRFECEGCGGDHNGAGEFCEGCERFLEQLEQLVEQHPGPLGALKLYLQDEFDWVVFASDDEFEEECVERMREMACNGMDL